MKSRLPVHEMEVGEFVQKFMGSRKLSQCVKDLGTARKN